MIEHDVLIAAGGHASRYFGSYSRENRPKSLLLGKNQPILLSTVQAALDAGYKNILVSNNRPEWHASLSLALKDIPQITLVKDRGFESTFLLAKLFSNRMRPRFIFLYGHAPRTASHIRKMHLTRSGLVTSGFSASSRGRACWFQGQFLEPPFLVDTKSVEQSNASDWQDFFSENEQNMHVVKCSAPNEANTLAEFDRFCDFYFA